MKTRRRHLRPRLRVPRRAIRGVVALSAVTTGMVVIGAVASIPGAPSALAGGTWGSPIPVTGGTALSGISCVSSSFCTAVDTAGNAYTYNGASVTNYSGIDAGNQLDAVSCASNTFCAAVDNAGNALTFNGSSWTTESHVDGTNVLTGVSCPSTSFCAAVTRSGDVLYYGSGSFGLPSVFDGGNHPTSVSCVSSTFCVAVDGQGNALSYNGSSWTIHSGIDVTGILSASCASTSMCVAVDHAGNALTSPDGSNWTLHSGVDTGNQLNAVSCPTSAFCAAVDANGNALTSSDGATWTVPVSVAPAGLLAVSCPMAVFCAAVDTVGDAVVYTPNAATITNVQFSGTTASPVVIVSGSGFGTMSNLGTPGAAGCAQTGSDFGNNLFIQDWTGPWLAGRGTACIGLFITSYSDTQVIFTFGSDYSFYSLSSDDNFTVSLLGANFTGFVNYVGTSTDYYCNAPGVGLITVPTIIVTSPTPPMSLTAPGTYRPALTVLSTVPASVVNAALASSVTEVSIDDATMAVAQDGGSAFTSPTEQASANNLPLVENFTMNTPFTAAYQFNPMTWTSGPGIGTSNFQPGETDVLIDGNHGSFSETLQCFPPGPQASGIGGPSGPVPTLGTTTVSAPTGTPAVQVPAVTDPELPKVTPGASVLWKILVSNTSSAPDPNVVANVYASTGATPLSFDLKAMTASGNICSSSGATDDHISCSIGTLAHGASTTVYGIVPTTGLASGATVSGQVSIAATGATTATGSLGTVGVVSIPNTVIGAAVPGVQLTNTRARLSNSNPVVISLKLPKKVVVSSLATPFGFAGPVVSTSAGARHGRSPGRRGAAGTYTGPPVTGSAGPVSATIGPLDNSQDQGVCPQAAPCYGYIAQVDGNFTTYTDKKHPIKLQLKYQVNRYVPGTTLWMRKDEQCSTAGTCTGGGVVQVLPCGPNPLPCYTKLVGGGTGANQYVMVKLKFVGVDPRFGLRA